MKEVDKEWEQIKTQFFLGLVVGSLLGCMFATLILISYV